MILGVFQNRSLNISRLRILAKMIHSFAAENNKEKITTGRVEQVDIDQQVGSAFIVRRTNFDLKKAQARAHILEGQLKALDVFFETALRHRSVSNH